MSKLLKSKFLLGLMMVVAFALVASTASASITSTLKYGSRGAQVTELQQGLGVSPATGYFGNLTKAAVKAWQASKGLVADGIFGAKSRAQWTGGSMMYPAGCTSASGFSPTTGLPCSGGVTTQYPAGCTSAVGFSPTTGLPCSGVVVVPTSGMVTVSLATTNPAPGNLATGTASNSMLAFTLANGTSTSVNVTGLNLTKTGFYNNTEVTGVSVFDGNGVRHGNVVTTLGAAGVANMTFGSDPIVVPASSSVTVTVKVDLSGTTGGLIGFNVNQASDILGTTAVGTFPIVGNQMNVYDGTNSIGAVTLGVLPVNASGVSLNADANSEQDITKFRVASTNSNEDVMLYGLTLWNNGNASSTDYKDVQLLDQTGVVLATAQPMGINKTVSFSLATPYLITKGQTKDFWVKAKLVDGASRTIQFVVYNNYDLAVKGVSTGAFLLPTAAGNDTSFPVGDQTSTYNKVTIASGSLVFSRATDSPATAMTPGANDVVLAKFNAKPVGENMELRGLSFGVYQSSVLTGTVYVKVNGSVVFSAAAGTSNFALAGTVAARTLSSYPILTAGVDNTIEVTASISSSATAADSYYVNDFDITSVKRAITNDILDPAVSVQDGYTRAVQAGALVTTTLSTPVAASIVPGTNNVPLAAFEFNASSSGEDVRVTSVTVTDTVTGGTSTYGGMANLVMKDASGAQLSTSSSTATNANTVAFNFTNAIVVSRTATTKIYLYGDLLNNTDSTTHTYKIAAAGNVTATGASTGNTITSSVAGSGQLMTAVASGTMALSTVSGTGATPSLAQLALVGQPDGVYLAGRITSQFEAQKVISLTLKATGTFGVAATAQQDITNIRLYAQTGSGALSASAVPFATTSQFSSCTTTVCTYTWTAADNLLPMTVVPGTPVTVFAKADIQGAGTAYLGDKFYMGMTETAQVNTETPTAVNSTVYTTTINGTAVTYTSDGSATVAEITAGLVAAINANTTVNPYVTAADATTNYTITSDVEGLGFTLSVDANQANVATTANDGIAVKGAVSNVTLLAAATSGSASTSGGTTSIVPQQILVTADASFLGGNTAAANGTTLARFKVTNNGSAQVTIDSFKVTDSGSNSLTVAGTDTYKLWTSDDGAANYQGNAASSTTSSLRDPSSGVTTWTVNQNNTINGGSYRYFTVTLNDSTGAASGNSWTMGVAALGDVTFTATEANLGYDGNQDGDLADTTGSLYTDGKPSSATVTKQ